MHVCMGIGIQINKNKPCTLSRSLCPGRTSAGWQEGWAKGTSGRGAATDLQLGGIYDSHYLREVNI